MCGESITQERWIIRNSRDVTTESGGPRDFVTILKQLYHTGVKSLI